VIRRADHPYRTSSAPSTGVDVRRAIIRGLVATVVVLFASLGLRNGMAVHSVRVTPESICNVAPDVGRPFDRASFDRAAHSVGLSVQDEKQTRSAGIVSVFRSTSFFGGYGCTITYSNGRVWQKRRFYVDS
jgi:hypothetical protein